MFKNLNEAINIALTIFIFYYLINNVFKISLLNDSSSLKETFISNITSTLFKDLTHSIKENLESLNNNLASVNSKVDSLKKETKTNKVEKKPEKKKCDMTDDMIEHLNQVIEDHDESIKKIKKEECNSNEYIYSNYQPSSKADDVKEITSVNSSQVKNLVEMKLDVGEKKKVSSDPVSDSPNYKTDNESNAYVNNMTSYCNENQMSGGDMEGIYAFDNEVSEFGSFM